VIGRSEIKSKNDGNEEKNAAAVLFSPFSSLRLRVALPMAASCKRVEIASPVAFRA